MSSQHRRPSKYNVNIMTVTCKLKLVASTMTGVIVGGNASTRHVTNCGANFLGTLTLIDSLHCPFLARAAAKPQARKVNITKYYSFFVINSLCLSITGGPITTG